MINCHIGMPEYRGDAIAPVAQGILLSASCSTRQNPGAIVSGDARRNRENAAVSSY